MFCDSSLVYKRGKEESKTKAAEDGFLCGSIIFVV